MVSSAARTVAVRGRSLRSTGLAEVGAGPELADVPAAARHFGVHRCDDVERLAWV
jgi:hypothetical protein